MRKSAQHPEQPKLQRPAQTTYDVGYGKPPAHSRFQPGQSGNCKGRPKGAKSKLPALNEERLKTIVLEEAYRSINVREGEKNISIPMARAVVRALAVSAAKGNNRAAQLFTILLQTIERENRQLHDEWLNTAISYKIEWEKEFRRREKLGITGPEPLPHPDDIVVNMRTGEVRIKGPMMKEEKELWDQARIRKAECDETIAALERELKESPDHPHRQQMLNDIEHERYVRTLTGDIYPILKPFDKPR